MRTRKQELVSDDLKPFVCNIMKEYREKYNYSLEDLARALNYKKNRQTLHKYETGTLNIPYEIFFDIANIFNINSDVFDEIPMTKDEKDLFEKKMIRSYVNTMTGNNNITSRVEKIVNELESGELDLDKSITKYTEAMKLIEFCETKLNNATETINKLVNENGTETKFEVEEN